MRRFLAALLSIAPLLLPGATAAVPSGGPRFRVEAGYNTFALGEVHDAYDSLLEPFRDANVPIGTQRDFPGNLFLGGEVLWPLTPSVRGGFTARTSWTHGYSAYSDANGSLDVDAALRMFSGGWVLSRDLRPVGGFRPQIDVQMGLVWTQIRFEQEIHFTEFPELDDSVSETFRAADVLAELSLVVERPVGGILVVGRVGGRYADPIDRGLGIHLSGVVLSLGLAFGS